MKRDTFAAWMAILFTCGAVFGHMVGGNTRAHDQAARSMTIYAPSCD